MSAIVLNSKTVLDWTDYTVITAILIICACFGFHFRQRNKTEEDPEVVSNGNNRIEQFFLAGRSLSIFPVAMSIMATSLSGFSMTGVTAEIYLYGATFVMDFVGICIGCIFAAYFIVPIYRKSNFISVFEVMEDRFDPMMRKVFALLYILQKLLYLSLVLYLPSLALMTLTNFDYRVTTLVLGFVCTSYSTLGGLRAVIWTDVIQAILMFTTLLVVIFQSCWLATEPFWSTVLENGYLSSISWVEDSSVRYSFWAVTSFGFMWALDLFLVNQALLQRVLGAHSDIAAKRAVIFGGSISLLFGFTIALASAVLYGYYNRCDPLKLKEYTGIEMIDQLFVYAIGDLFHNVPLVKGLAISGIASASLSTFSSYVNSFAAVALEDFIKPSFPNFTSNERRNLVLCMALSFGFGTIAILGSFLIPFLGNAVKALGIMNGILGGPVVGAAFLTIFYKPTTKMACLFGLFFGIAFNAWIIFGSFYYAGDRHFETLPTSTDDCIWNATENIIFVNLADENGTSANSTLYASNLEDESNYLNISASNSSVPDFSTENKSFFMPFYQISFMWYPLIGFVIANLSGFIISLVTRAKIAKRIYRKKKNDGIATSDLLNIDEEEEKLNNIKESKI